METTIARWGHSLGLRIPKAAAVELGLAAGDCVSITSSAEGLWIKKTRKKSKFDLAELLTKITPDNTHTATDWGRPEGKEVW